MFVFLFTWLARFAQPVGKKIDDRGCSGPITRLASFKDTVWRVTPRSTGLVNKIRDSYCLFEKKNVFLMFKYITPVGDYEF